MKRRIVYDLYFYCHNHLYINKAVEGAVKQEKESRIIPMPFYHWNHAWRGVPAQPISAQSFTCFRKKYEMRWNLEQGSHASPDYLYVFVYQCILHSKTDPGGIG